MIRMAAGIQLKNNLTRHFSELSPDAIQYIKSEVLNCLGDNSHVVRNTTGSIVSSIVSSADGLNAWPELLGILVSFLDNSNINVVDGALNTLHKLCEDHNEQLERAEQHEALSALIPRFLAFFRSPHEHFRRLAVSSVVQFIVHMPPALLSNLDTFLQVCCTPSCKLNKNALGRILS
jgi:transportin-1